MVCCELFFLNIYEVVTWVVLRYIFFRQITTFIKVLVTFAFGLKTLSMVDFTWIYQLKSLKPKNKGDTNFYECCDLTKNVYLVCRCVCVMSFNFRNLEDLILLPDKLIFRKVAFAWHRSGDYDYAHITTHPTAYDQ